MLQIDEGKTNKIVVDVYDTHTHTLWNKIWKTNTVNKQSCDNILQHPYKLYYYLQRSLNSRFSFPLVMYKQTPEEDCQQPLKL